jgi:hypothetical protein
VSDPVPTPVPEREAKKSGSGCGWIIFVCILVLLCGIAIPPPMSSIKRAPQSAAMQQAHAIDLAMFSYANDNNGKYPDGQTSTEVFQKLIDGGYISDPSLLYVPYPGKIKAASDQKKLKPENVSFDVTCCADGSAPDDLPLVFLTGCKVTYKAGGSAVPLAEPVAPSGWFWRSTPTVYPAAAGIAVSYKSNVSKFIQLKAEVNSDGSISFPLKYAPDAVIHDFVPPDFPSNGKTYRQLTPSGPLP